VMSEEKATDFRTEAVSENVKRIVSIGQDPWLVKEFSGEVRFRRADAAELTVTALDAGGYPLEKIGSASLIRLRPTTMYYVIESRPKSEYEPGRQP